MVKAKKTIRYPKIKPEQPEDQIRMKIFDSLKINPALPIINISKETETGEDVVAEYLNGCVKKGLLKIAGAGKFEFNDGDNTVLGVGFTENECVLSVMDPGGEILNQEKINVGMLFNLKGKNKEIKEIVNQIAGKTKFKKQNFCLAALAMPETIEKATPKGANILAEGIMELFNCDVLVVKQATASRVW